MTLLLLSIIHSFLLPALQALGILQNIKVYKVSMANSEQDIKYVLKQSKAMNKLTCFADQF